MKKQLLLVSAVLGLTTASFASNMEEGSKLQTYGSISSVLKVLSESKPAEAVPNGNVFNKFAADIGVSSEEGKKALYGALVGESDIKAELSEEVANGFQAEKVKAETSIVSAFDKNKGVFQSGFDGTREDIEAMYNPKTTGLTIEDVLANNGADLKNAVLAVYDGLFADEDSKDLGAGLVSKLLDMYISSVKQLNEQYNPKTALDSFAESVKTMAASEIRKKEQEFEGEKSLLRSEVEKARSTVGEKLGKSRMKELEDLPSFDENRKEQKNPTKFEVKKPVKIEEPKSTEEEHESPEEKPIVSGWTQSDETRLTEIETIYKERGKAGTAQKALDKKNVGSEYAQLLAKKQAAGK